MRRYDVIAEICDYMLELGWWPYQNDHEDANGQFEMNWEFDDVMSTADKHSFFKLTPDSCSLLCSLIETPSTLSRVNIFLVV